MSLSETRRGVLLGALALGGCGFTPVYGPGGTGNLLRGRLEAADPTTPLGFSFVEQVETRLGRAAGAPFVLRYRLTTEEDALAFTADREIQRYQLLGSATWEVIDRARDLAVTEGRTESFIAYSAVGTTVATRAAQQDAIRRLAVVLADRVVAELLGTAATWAAA